MTDPAALLAAGAVLPPATGAGQPDTDRSVPDRSGPDHPWSGQAATTTARHYRHPAAEGRVVVRLAPEELGRAEDLTAEFLGFPVPERVRAVGRGRRVALGFPAWALVNDPANGHHALALVKDLERVSRQASGRPTQAKEQFLALGERLGRSAPHFLPTFYEQAARAFVAAGNPAFAAVLFGKAREAERVHDLAVDHDRLREVFLEFAFAGALTAKALSAHARGLAGRGDPAASYALFRALCVKRTQGGLPPYTGMPEDLNRLAKAAGLDQRAEQRSVLSALLGTTAVTRANAGFWKSYRSALVDLARADAGVRRRLLEFVPADAAALDTWLGVLTASGAADALTDPDGPPPPVTAAHWLATAVATAHPVWDPNPRSQALLDLVERMLPRLRADGHPVELLRGWRTHALDVLDLVLAGGVPVAPPLHPDSYLTVGKWLADEAPGRRDLRALAASEFADALGEGLVVHLERAVRADVVDAGALAAACAVPGLRAALGAWITTRSPGPGPHGLPALRERLAELRVVGIPEAFADVPEAADAIAATDVTAAVLTTLRAGLYDELGWPALDRAHEDLAALPPGDLGTRIVGEGWPALVLGRGERLVVVGPDGVLDEHRLRVPADQRHGLFFRVGADWHDGSILVRWPSPGGERAYWSHAPGSPFPLTDRRPGFHRAGALRGSIAVGDGRFAGGRVVQLGDTDLPVPADPLGDGQGLWAYRGEPWDWHLHEVDPATGDAGRASLPAFLEDFATTGAQLVHEVCELRPAVPETANSPLGAANGLHGWRVRREADRSWSAEGIDGRAVRRPKGGEIPAGLLHLPSGGRLVLMAVHNGLRLLDVDGTELGRLDALGDEPCQEGAAGSPVVPPLDWWHVLRPRDEAGSAALRAVTREAVDALLDAATDADGQVDELDEHDRQGWLAAVRRGEPDALAEAITAALPGLTHPGLIAGVADVVRRAALLRAGFRAFAAFADTVRALGPEALAATGPTITDWQVDDALSWFREPYRATTAPVPSGLPTAIAALGRAAGAQLTEPTPLPPLTCHYWTDHLHALDALLYRAASPLTPADQRAALVAVLRATVAAGLHDEPGRWRNVVVRCPETTPANVALPTADGFLVTYYRRRDEGGGVIQAVGLQFTREPDSPSPPPGMALLEVRPARGALSGANVLRFLDALAERGPAPWRPDAGPALAALTGAGRVAATALLTGMPGLRFRPKVFLDAAERALVGLSSAETASAGPVLGALSDRRKLVLLAAAVPADPLALWESGPDVEAVAREWTAVHGKRAPLPEDLQVLVNRELWHDEEQRRVSDLVNPDLARWLHVDGDTTLVDAEPVASDKTAFDDDDLSGAPGALAWLAYRLPAASPLRPALARSLDLVRARLAHEGFAFLLADLQDTAAITDLTGVEVGPVGEVGRHREWLEVARSHFSFCALLVRPALLRPQDRPLLDALTEVLHARWPVSRLRLALDPGLAAACAATAPGGTGPDTYFQDPAFSVPHLVERVADRHGLPADAAALYLQLLALPDPTDANVARWTGWKPARLKKARAALADTDLVVGGRRSRAGRSLFLPGGWLDQRKPRLPLEVWKTSLYGDVGYPDHSTGVIAPAEPVADLFARAWERVLTGDAPAYDPLTTGGDR
ncbi:hypothetical protein [Actinosynnema mirum]|uniref:DNA-binding protein n=1 Tax=Actinosynnema mirum (strain ATCC 29888 / DSM 43827 / JCM 3225 / NBRC 14064 / NCIMB 13271 / NRRL B-12336 / IMRU 3971 / 101) TaxID=446462 RepID=C6WL93_ACTMD|nr:hypothetical protein [Actinosynnema mirum]ACU36446.1 hypothetical protein Amir_2508 [Actinosynnema mirum DSM 43827]